MTLYLLFAGLSVLLYLGAAVAAAASGPDRAHVDLASSREVGDAPGIVAVNRPRATIADAGPARAQAVGERLFHERGCIGCHRPDATGIGPALAGLFGRPASDAGCGAVVVDDEYLREAILNPSATVAAGFAPVMPAFAGRLSEEELRALIAYVKSQRAR